MKVKPIVSAVLLSLMVGSGVRGALTQTATVLAPCSVGTVAPPIGFWTWAANSRVKVYLLSTDFTTEQIPYLLAAFDNWNNVLEQTGAGVKFDYKGNTTQQLSCQNCLTIMRGPVFDKTRRHATELKAFSVRHDQIISYAVIIIDPNLTNPEALLDAVAHEIGHNLGLLDCYTCKKRSTLMNQLKAMNIPNDMPKPTLCDIAQVRSAYLELKVHIRPSPAKRDLDEGEEPVDDDTPIVIPKPPKL